MSVDAMACIRILSAKRKCMGWRVWPLIALAGGLFLGQATHAQPAVAQPAPFIVGTDADPRTYLGRWAHLIYENAFKRMGIPLDYRDYPLPRRSALINEAFVDAEAGRIYAYGAAHPNLVRVEEPIMELRFSLYTANPAVRLQRLEELSASGLLVEYRRGIMYCENTLKPLLPTKRLSNISSANQGISKLLAKRTDLYCDLDLTVQGLLHTPEFKDAAGLRKALDIGKPMAIYPYFHQKHAALAVRMANTLKQMKAEGVIEAYRLQVERELGWHDASPKAPAKTPRSKDQ